MFVLPSGTVLHILLSLLGVNIMCGWALPNLYFSASMLLLWGCTGYRGTGKIHTMIPVVLQDQVVCHVAGHASAILLYVSWTHRLRGASRAINSLTPLLLLPPRCLCCGTGQQGKTPLWVEQCTINGEVDQVSTETEDMQNPYCWFPASVNSSLHNLSYGEDNLVIKQFKVSLRPFMICFYDFRHWGSKRKLRSPSKCQY